MANPHIGSVNTGGESGTAFSDIVCMSSGQLYFSNKNAAVWGPEQLPTLPHAFLSIGAKSVPYVDNTMIDSLQFINRIT